MLRSTFAVLKKTIATQKNRFNAFDDRLDAWADRHWPVLSILGYALSFVLLFGGVALHAYESGLAHAIGVQCGPIGRTNPGFEYGTAVLCGGAAILFVKLYARLTAGVQRTFIDPFKYVRPEPSTKEVARWAASLHCLIGIALFFAMAGIAKEQIPGRFEVQVGMHGSLEMLLGWWVGGLTVLRFFWPKYPRGGSYTRDHAADARRTYDAELKTRGIIDER
jgi:hypothetical protein